MFKRKITEQMQDSGLFIAMLEPGSAGRILQGDMITMPYYLTFMLGE